MEVSRLQMNIVESGKSLLMEAKQAMCYCMLREVQGLREGFKNPSNGNFPLRGYPPLSGLRLAEKLAEIS